MHSMYGNEFEYAPYNPYAPVFPGYHVPERTQNKEEEESAQK